MSRGRARKGTCLDLGERKMKSYVLNGIARVLSFASWPAFDAMRRALPESARGKKREQAFLKSSWKRAQMLCDNKVSRGDLTSHESRQ